MNINFNLLLLSPLLMQGAWMTIQLWLTAALIALSLGILIGLLRSRKLRMPWFAYLLDGITFILRGVPFYVQLLMAYFVIPELIGINCSAFTAATIALGLCSSAYVSQIVRGGINAVSAGQWEAAMVLGYTTYDTVRYVIVPQMIRIVLPALNGELDQLLKSTSVISAIGVLELTGAAKNIIAREMNPLPMYTAIAVIYVLFSSVLNVIAAISERRLNV